MRYTPIVALAGVAAVQATSSGAASKVSSSIASSKPWSSASSGSYSKSGSASSIKSHHSKSSSAAVPTTTMTSEHSVPTTASESEYGTWVTEWETVVETIYVCPTDSSTWTFPSTYTTISTETIAPPVSTSSAPIVVPTSSVSKQPYHSHSGASTGISGTGRPSGSISKTIKPTSAPSPSSCPTTLTPGSYEYPHLIVPVDSSAPNTARGTSYNGTLSATVSSIFDFDIPASDAGKTCSLVFLFPELSQLETSAYAFNGQGGIQIQPLASPATQQTTYANMPAAAGAATTIANLTPGNSYVVSTGPCPAGQRVAYEFSAVGGLELNFFEDYNPSPLGAYITTC